MRYDRFDPLPLDPDHDVRRGRAAPSTTASRRGGGTSPESARSTAPIKDVRLPKYATLANYEQNIEWNIHRYCGYWGRGI